MMIITNAVNYVILTSEVVRGQKRSNLVITHRGAIFCRHAHMMPPNIIDYAILTSEVIRGYWRSKEVKIGNYSQGCNFLWTYSYHTPKYYRICYFDLRGH